MIHNPRNKSIKHLSQRPNPESNTYFALFSTDYNGLPIIIIESLDNGNSIGKLHHLNISHNKFSRIVQINHIGSRVILL